MTDPLDKEIDALMHDERIVSMAGELCSKCIIRGEDPIEVMRRDYPAFIVAAYDQYRKRGGAVDCSVGSPAEAIMRISVIMARLAKNELPRMLDSMKEDVQRWADSVEDEDE